MNGIDIAWNKMNEIKVITVMIITMTIGFGCAAPKALPDRTVEGQIVWPGPPEKPRIRYLWSLSVVESFGAEGKRGLLDYLFGGEEELLDPRLSSTLMRPLSVFVDGNNTLYIADTGAFRVTVIRLDDLTTKHIRKAGDVEFAFPVGVAADSAGRIFISDSILRKVYIFDSRHKLIGMFDGDLLRPTGLAVDNVRGRVYVADTLAHTIYAYTPDGKWLMQIGGRGEQTGAFNYPTHIFVDRDGLIYISDTMNFRVQVFGPDGAFIRTIGVLGKAYGHLEKIKGVAADSYGHIYVVDSINDMIKIFNQDGLLLLFFGSKGSGYGEMWLPSGIFIDRNDTIYVADTYNMRIQVFEYIKEQ